MDEIAVKERSIIFSGPMVRAILAGRKTQTRRLVEFPLRDRDFDLTLTAGSPFSQHEARLCPYGQPGGRLWVRETWQGPLVDDIDAYRIEPSDYHKPEFCQYAADGGAPPEFITLDDDLVRRWSPSSRMPRWASRITLEVVSVRVERLQEISEKDALAEGVNGAWRGNLEITPKETFNYLWDSINAKRAPWESNPWVWVVEFKKTEAKQ